jgi:restriction endonuclease S subunit
MVTMVAQPKLYGQRWSPEPWNPEFLMYIEQIKNYHNGYTTLEKLLKPNGFAFPDCVRKSKGESFGKHFKTRYYSVSGILETGFDLTIVQRCSDSAYERLSHTQLHENDILIARSGAGSVGKVSIVNFDPGQSCTGDLFVLRIQGYEPEALFVFLKSNHAQKQFARQIHGTTGMVKLNTTDIKQTLVPLFSNSLQLEIGKHFKTISKLHFDALEHKRKKNQREFERIIRIAESEFENLKRRVELTIAKNSDILLKE